MDEGNYQITQGENFLSALDGIAVTMPHNIGGAFIWQITPPPNNVPNPVGPIYSLSLLPNGGIPPGPGIPPVLTLGPDPGLIAPVLVQPPVPGAENQLWIVQPMPPIFP